MSQYPRVVSGTGVTVPLAVLYGDLSGPTGKPAGTGNIVEADRSDFAPRTVVTDAGYSTPSHRHRTEYN